MARAFDLVLHLDKDTRNYYLYKGGGVLYVPKAQMGDNPPDQILVTVEPMDTIRQEP